MKTILKQLLILASIAGFTLPAMAELGPVNLFLVQSGSTATTISYDLDISGLKSSVDASGSPSLGAFDVYLNFDPAVVSIQSVGLNYGVTFGTNLALNSVSDFSFASPVGASQIELFDLSNNSASELLAGQSSAFTLATVTFDITASGATGVSIDSSSSLSDENGNTLAAVPEPSASMLGLIGAACLGFAYFRRRALSVAC